MDWCNSVAKPSRGLLPIGETCVGRDMRILCFLG